MLHTSRQAIRFIILSIGFVLFVVMSIISASTANSRQAVAGKPHLMPWQDTASLASADTAGDNGDLAMSQVISAAVPTPHTAAPSPAQSDTSPRNQPASNGEQSAAADSGAGALRATDKNNGPQAKPAAAKQDR
jgi:hypothetical protein